MVRLLQRIAIAVLALAAAVYVVDYTTWFVRNTHGNAMGSIPVDTYLATPLKGNKAEYDYLGTAPQPCARALFPHGGAPACWWLARHTSQWE
jgi:hypothetical protein